MAKGTADGIPDGDIEGFMVGWSVGPPIQAFPSKHAPSGHSQYVVFLLKFGAQEQAPTPQELKKSAVARQHKSTLTVPPELTHFASGVIDTGAGEGRDEGRDEGLDVGGAVDGGCSPGSTQAAPFQHNSAGQIQTFVLSLN